MLNLSKLVWIVTGVWSGWLTLVYIYGEWEVLGVIVSLVIAPLVALAPLHAGFTNDYWDPLLIGYGGFAVGFLLNVFSKKSK